jgi:hypothetical protein
VSDCRASIYGNLTGRRIPYSEGEKEGAVSTEYVRARHVGHLCVESRSGAGPPTMIEAHRSGLTLRSMEQVEIDPGRSVVVTAGLRLLSFRGQKVRIAQSVLGPGNRGMIRIHTALYIREDHGKLIAIKVANFGCLASSRFNCSDWFALCSGTSMISSMAKP